MASWRERTPPAPTIFLRPERFDRGGEIGGAGVDVDAVGAGPAGDPRVVVDEAGDAARRGDRHERLGQALQGVRIGRIGGDDQRGDVAAGERSADQPRQRRRRRCRAASPGRGDSGSFPPLAWIDPRRFRSRPRGPRCPRLVAKYGCHQPLAETL